MTNNSSQNNGNVTFSIDLNDYDDNDAVAFGDVIHKIGKVKTVIKQMSQRRGSLHTYLVNEFKNSLGTPEYWEPLDTAGEILKATGNGWKKGKIKFELTAKFYPDELEPEEVSQADSSFDDIRLMVNKIS